jgi:hypothetical protein
VVIVAVVITGEFKVHGNLRLDLTHHRKDLVPMIEVATWRSYVNLLATMGRSIGGPLGGLLADTVGWRW